jgi:hypothetical protein
MHWSQPYEAVVHNLTPGESSVFVSANKFQIEPASATFVCPAADARFRERQLPDAPSRATQLPDLQGINVVVEALARRRRSCSDNRSACHA